MNFCGYFSKCSTELCTRCELAESLKVTWKSNCVPLKCALKVWFSFAPSTVVMVVLNISAAVELACPASAWRILEGKEILPLIW